MAAGIAADVEMGLVVVAAADNLAHPAHGARLGLPRGSPRGDLDQGDGAAGRGLHGGMDRGPLNRSSPTAHASLTTAHFHLLGWVGESIRVSRCDLWGRSGGSIGGRGCINHGRRVKEGGPEARVTRL